MKRVSLFVPVMFLLVATGSPVLAQTTLSRTRTGADRDNVF